MTVADFESWMGRNYIAGAWLGGQLVGAAGFHRLDGAKIAHRGNLWGVYVKPHARGHGIARSLITDVLAYARTQVKQVHLSVVSGNESARRLYEDLGFAIYGTEPRSLLVEGHYLDEHLMVLRFD